MIRLIYFCTLAILSYLFFAQPSFSWEKTALDNAELLIQKEKYHEALLKLRMIESQDNSQEFNAYFNFDVGTCYYHLEEYDKALESLGLTYVLIRAREIKEIDEKILIEMIADCQYFTGQIDMAVESYKKLLSLNPSNSELGIKLAKIFSEAGKLNEAEKIYLQLLESKEMSLTASEELEVILLFGKLKEKQGDLKAARAFFERAYRIDNNDERVRKALTEHYIKIGNYKDAEILSETSSSTLNATTLRSKGDIKLKQGKGSDANSFYWRALELDSSLRLDPEFLSNYALSFELEGEYENAARIWSDYLELRPGHDKAIMSLADCLMRTGRVTDASKAEEIYKTIFTERSSEEIFLKLLDALSAQNKLEEINFLLENSGMNSLQVRLKGASINELAGNFIIAEMIYQELLNRKEFQNDLQARFNYALCLARQSKDEQAISEYKKILEIKPNFTEAIYSLGVLYIDKNPELTKKYWKRYLEIDPKGTYKKQISNRFPELVKK